MSIRLIDTFTLSLKSFLGNTPPYAILSHTWEDEEVSFQDMLAIENDSHHLASAKSGYAKVVATCRQASRRGIGYVWVDTCCIDKTSSSEISEAINSMYQWYWNAEICFAVLVDLAVTTALEIALSKCRWFTRGWCLQELIAPKAIEFYDRRWNCIGVKVDLTALLSSITHIDEQVLVERSRIEEIPVGRKMSWAATRKTTRIEDIAYCLLGIFNVHMPMLYGEGSRAFTRLQEEIVKTSNDLSLFAFSGRPRNDPYWTPASNVPPYCDLFAASPGEFAGCRSLVGMGTNMHGNDAFTLTNRGLHFPRTKLEVDMRHGAYTLSLNCRLSDPTVARIYLQKVGPGLFAKFNYNDSRHTDTANELRPDTPSETHTEIEEVYIIAVMSRSLQLQLQSSGGYAVRVTSRAYQLSRALQVFRRVPSSNRWDTARMQFLTNGDRGVQAFWRLFPNLAQPVAGTKSVLGKSSSPCNLLCGVQYHEDSLHPRAWVRLCSSEEWRRLETEFGISITQGNDTTSLLDTGKTVDHITMDTTSSNPITITATIWLEEGWGGPYFRLELEFDSPTADEARMTIAISDT
ncbi:hypothetical protein MMC15_000581 [Xylographa vitiligo]|nr:hypothetical protein [Xylographa vitiligo]